MKVNGNIVAAIITGVISLVFLVMSLIGFIGSFVG